MNFKIGFTENTNDKSIYTPATTEEAKITPRKSVVKVHFPSRGQAWSYYNESFDLHKGDLVFVEGKLEGERGIVVDVNYNFKIKISDYKRVIAVADTEVKGEVFFADSHFLAFDPTVIPYEKVSTWFNAPDKPEDEIVCGSDDSSFLLEELDKQKIPANIYNRGCDYYVDNRVVYLSLDGENGRAIVDGSEYYDVEFTYKNGEISALTCNCFCSHICKHDVATMLQLKDFLKTIEKNYADKYEQTNYFAAIFKSDFYSMAIGRREKGSIVLM